MPKSATWPTASQGADRRGSVAEKIPFDPCARPVHPRKQTSAGPLTIIRSCALPGKRSVG